VDTPDTFNTAAVQYLKFRRRRWIASWVFWVSYISLIPISLEIGSLNVSKSSSLYAWTFFPLLAVVAVSVWLRRRYRKLADETLPTIEAKTMVFQQLAVKSLAAFIQNRGKSFRRECLKNLRSAASFIDDWSVGNLQFLQKQFGDKMEDFKKAFRFRLIPAVERAEADSDTTKRIYQWLVISVQNELLSGFDGTRLDASNNCLSNFEEKQPQGKRRRLATRTVMYNIAYLSFVIISTSTYFGFQRSILGADVNTATNGINVVLTILLAPYAVYLFTKYQSRKGPKTK